MIHAISLKCSLVHFIIGGSYVFDLSFSTIFFSLLSLLLPPSFFSPPLPSPPSTPSPSPSRLMLFSFSSSFSFTQEKKKGQRKRSPCVVVLFPLLVYQQPIGQSHPSCGFGCPPFSVDRTQKSISRSFLFFLVFGYSTVHSSKLEEWKGKTGPSSRG
ncbi:hypothetical protein K457DRAFT_711648 [Linnemannia elongata AG-77]|uniref:Transmembrane protein n=1 Tax=Linnemannia elongata AG-77 TaxID=1314771 RepID=A0A197KC68_9FUNG|nr:hypothetical protein K457DRAFT_711648 [Linnemannia elongata AG-77]